MKYDEVVGRYSQACAACELNGQIVRNGNWEPVARALRHYSKDGSAEIGLVAEQGGTAILEIKPAAVDPKTVPPGKSAFNRPAFHLIVQ